MILIIPSILTKNTIFKPSSPKDVYILHSIQYSLANKNNHHCYNKNYFVLSEIIQICPPIYQYLLLIFTLFISFLSSLNFFFLMYVIQPSLMGNLGEYYFPSHFL